MNRKQTKQNKSMEATTHTSEKSICFLPNAKFIRRTRTQSPTLKTSRPIRGQVLPYAVSDRRAVLEAMGQREHTRYRSIHDEGKNNQRHSKPVLVLVEDQSNCIFVSITENGTKVIRWGDV